MTDINRLERHYRRLLRAYPMQYRVQRGDEIITTLLDAAEEDHRPTSTKETIGLLLSGARQRLSTPGFASRLAAVLVAVFTALLGAIAGALGGWLTAPDLASAAESDRIAQQALSVDHVEGADHAYLFGWDEFDDQSQTTVFMGGDDYGAGYRERVIEHEADDYALLRAAHDNLAAAGWEVSGVQVEGDSYASFEAARDSTVMEVETSPETTLGPPTSDTTDPSVTSVYIERAQPWTVPVLTFVGLAVGAVLGWWLTAAISRRMTSWPWTWRLAVALPFVGGVITFTPPMLFNLFALGYYLSDLSQFSEFWIGFIHPMTGYPALAGALCLLLTSVVVTVGRFRDPRREAAAPETELAG